MTILDTARHIALVSAIGCAESGGEEAAAAGDEQLFVPAGLPNTEANEAEGGLTLVAFTLMRRESGLALYAAARNDGETPVCEPGMTTDFVDHDQRLVGSAGMTLYTGHFYRIEDGSGAIISCAPPGGIAMGASLTLPDSIIIDELAFLSHAFPAFVVPNLAPTDGLTLRDVTSLKREAGTAYAGTFHNDLELSVTNARVAVFPLNRVGRPLAVASVETPSTVPPQETWAFETSTVSDDGTNHAAFPSAAISY